MKNADGNKHAFPLRSEEVVSSKQAMGALGLSSKGGWPMRVY